MTPVSGAPPQDPQESSGRRLDSWKEIASLLSRSISTVQRWEKDEGLPVRRLEHSKGSTVYAYEHELAEWLAQRSRNHWPQDWERRLLNGRVVGLTAALCLVARRFPQPA